MPSLWDRIHVFLDGKDIALLGPRSAGKSTLHHFLAHGRLPAQRTTPTMGPTPTQIYRNQRLDLKVKKGLDLPGGAASYPDWERQFKRSDIAIYVFDAKTLLDGDPAYLATLREHGKRLQEWGGAKKNVLMIGTHADLHRDWKRLGEAKFQDDTLDHDAVYSFRHRAGVDRAAVGSLLSEDKALALVLAALGRG